MTDSGGDTIAAVATAPGRGGVAVIRISGPDAFRVAGKVAGRAVSRDDAGRFFFSRFRDSSGAEIDQGLVLAFAAPHSYTGEDCAELQGHGGSAAPRRVLDACMAAGARLARRGEFTMRAFLNGRMEIGAAEAVLDLVDAKTDRAADDALLRLNGGARKKMEALYSRLVEASADMERFLDFEEDGEPAGFLDAMEGRIAELRAETRAMFEAAGETRVLRNGVLAVITGPPNAGKSSLLNALLGEERAIVSPDAGTTRDYIEETLDADGWPVRLVDTAGMREAASAAESRGVALAESLRREADIVIEARDGTAGPAAVPPHRGIAILARTKKDLPGFTPAAGALSVSSVTGEGITGLRAEIARAARETARRGDETSGAGDAERTREALRTAGDALDAAAAALRFDPAAAANGLRAAAEAAGARLGRVWSSDMLESVFSRFCVGK